jgi:uncharacterized membrane protein
LLSCNLLVASDIAILIVPNIFLMTATAGKVMYTTYSMIQFSPISY